jgi:endonuclease YncB( thermonuclease family)
VDWQEQEEADEQEPLVQAPDRFGNPVWIPAVFTAQVIGIPDADDLLVTTAETVLKVRLAEVDAPETGQPYHEEARAALVRLAWNKPVTVTFKDATWEWRRIYAWVRLPDGKDVSREMIRQGAAWHYREYSLPTNHPELDRLQAEAKAAKRGLWAFDNPIYPAIWRKTHPSRQQGR